MTDTRQFTVPKYVPSPSAHHPENCICLVDIESHGNIFLRDITTRLRVWGEHAVVEKQPFGDIMEVGVPAIEHLIERRKVGVDECQCARARRLPVR